MENVYSESKRNGQEKRVEPISRQPLGDDHSDTPPDPIFEQDLLVRRLSEREPDEKIDERDVLQTLEDLGFVVTRVASSDEA